MKRMKTFFRYFLMLLGFFVISTLIQILCFYSMYQSIIDNGTVQNSNGIELKVSKIKATNANGYMDLSATNNSGSNIENKYIKIELMNSQNLIAAVKYVPINSINNKESLLYKVTFNANNVEKYRVSVTNEAPNINSNVVNIFGIELDMENLVMKAKDTASRMPDFVYALLGVYVTLRSGKFLWMLYLLM